MLTGGRVLTMDPELGERHGDVVLEDGRIVDVTAVPGAGRNENDLVVDVSGGIVIPGLIDSHVHAWEGALRGLAPDAGIAEYWQLTAMGVGPHMTPEDIAIGQRVTAAQALNGGVTTIVDNNHNIRSYAHAEAAVDALRDTGIRAVCALGLATGRPPGFAQDLLRLREAYFPGDDQLLRLRLFAVDPDGWSFAAREGLGVVAEIGGFVPGVDDLFATGLIGPDHTYNHCTDLTPAQWDLIVDGGAAVNVAPRSDAVGGFARSSAVVEAGRRALPFGISCDNEVLYGQDMFTEMRTLLAVQRTLAFGTDVEPLGTHDVLRAATAGGAVNAGLAGRVGTLRPGSRADLVVLRTGDVVTRPAGPATGTVVNFMNQSHVEIVLVDGAPRKWAGALVGVDYPALAQAAEASRDRLVGLLPPPGR